MSVVYLVDGLASRYLFDQSNNGNTRKVCEICLTITIKHQSDVNNQATTVTNMS